MSILGRLPFECDYPVKKVNDCAHRFLAEYDYGGRELIYSDPPYLPHTRTSGRRYRFDYEEQDHIELLELLKTLPCNVILSGYPSALYDERLAGWRTLELQVMSHAGVRTDKPGFNFTPDRVHWASGAGRNFTDRQPTASASEDAWFLDRWLAVCRSVGWGDNGC